jgi:hypothetical protein
VISVEPLGQAVPGPAAADVKCARANNNLDLVRFGGRLYLAWRTAPTHFASAETRIEVTSAPGVDGPWGHEATFAMGRDLREPRFAVDGPHLHLFFMALGTDPKRFQPCRVHRAAFDGVTWGEPETAIDEPVVPWRIRRLAGRWTMSTYRGAEAMYGPFPADPTVEFRYSDDLESWGPPVVVHRGGIECEIVELGPGHFVGVTRNEGPRRFGSDLLSGPSPEDMAVVPIGRKLDSPNLFVWGGEPWLVARRSLAFGGRYDLAPRVLPGTVRIRVDQLAWWVTRKRSALYRLSGDGTSIEWMADLPSRGDTSFAGVIVEDDGSLLVADYTSPESTGDPRWVRGQLGPTVIQFLRVRRQAGGPARPQVALASSQASTVRARSSEARSTRSSGWWASWGSPGPKLAEGTPRAASVATSVQPTLARGGAPVARTSSERMGWPSPGGAPSARSTTSTWSPNCAVSSSATSPSTNSRAARASRSGANR